ncbi:hypothetical protein P4V64_19485 [Bacillus thuringiensis]|nr:hypothetical protein [Bacillus thuringiensis]
MRESAEAHCDFWRSGGRCRIRPDGIATCKYHREGTPVCRYLTLVVLKPRRGRRKHAEKKARTTAT